MDLPRLPVLAIGLVLAVLAFAPAPLGAEDTLDQRIAATDMTSADQVFALASWCHDHQRQVSAQKYYKEVLRLDPDHAGARDALGYVRVGEKWVPKAYAPASALKPADAPGDDQPEAASSPGPTADQVNWDASIPADPQPNDPFISKYIDRLPTIANDSNDMDVSVATCIDRKYWPSALPRLCQALQKSDFTDLYGASNMVMELARQGRLAEARPLLAYMVKATAHVSDPEDIESFCYAAAAFKDRRAVPRLIELIETGNPEVARAAGEAIAAIAHLPPTAMDAARAHAWWNANCNRSEGDALRAQLNSKDDATAIEAAKALYQLRDRAMVPTAIRCLSSADLLVRKSAVDLIASCTGDGWGFDPAASEPERTKVVQHIQAWWKENGDTFAFKDAGSTATPSQAAGDPAAEQVALLDRPEGTVATEAYDNLHQRGLSAVPALIDGLGASGVIVRRRCQELLQTITKQDIAFDPHGPDEARAQAVTQWRAWWDAHKPAANPPEAGRTGAGGGAGSDAGSAPLPHPAPPAQMPGM